MKKMNGILLFFIASSIGMVIKNNYHHFTNGDWTAISLLVFFSLFMTYLNTVYSSYWQRTAYKEERSKIRLQVMQHNTLATIGEYWKRFCEIAPKREINGFRSHVETILVNRYFQSSTIDQFVSKIRNDNSSAAENKDLAAMQQFALQNDQVVNRYYYLFGEGMRDAVASKRFSEFEKMVNYAKNELSIYKPFEDPDYKDDLKEMQVSLNRMKKAPQV